MDNSNGPNEGQVQKGDWMKCNKTLPVAQAQPNTVEIKRGTL